MDKSKFVCLNVFYYRKVRVSLVLFSLVELTFRYGMPTRVQFPAVAYQRAVFLFIRSDFSNIQNFKYIIEKYSFIY